MKVGDLVRLNSGGPLLTVSKIEKTDVATNVTFTWIGQYDCLSTGVLPIECLKHANSAPVAPDDAHLMRHTSAMDHVPRSSL